MTNSEISLQERVKTYCREYGVLKKDFAKMIDTSPASFSHWLNGRTLLKRITIEKIIAIIEK